MKKEDFIKFSEAQPEPNKHIIVTNNIDSTDAHGEMSHVWMTSHAFKSADENNGIVCYHGWSMVTNLTHWKYA